MRRLPMVARKDVSDTVRDRQIYVLGALFALAGAFFGYIVGQSTLLGAGALARFMLLGTVFLGALSMSGMAYNSVAGKRASGEMRVLLGLPISRFEVVFGSYVGRLAIGVGVVTIAYGVGATVAVLLGGAISPTALLGSWTGTVGIVVVFASIGIGVSASSRSTTRAAAVAFLSVFAFVFRIWELVPTAIRWLSNGFGDLGPTPEWALIWGQLSPIAGLRNVFASVDTAVANGLGPFVPTVEQSLFATEAWFGLLVLAVWIVVPLGVGYLRFEAADLG